MSLRRSARVANSSTSVVPENKATNGDVKYTKVSKPTLAPKKRTATAPATAPQDNPASTTNDHGDFAIPSLPATPLPKKRKVTSTNEDSPIKPPPFTPTPSGVGLIASSTSRELNHPLESFPRPAEPHSTNVPLSTPGDSHVVAYQSSPIKPEDPSPVKRRKAKEVVPPDVGALKNPSTNIDTLLKEAEEFLIGVDPKLKGLIEKHRCKMFSPEGLREVVDPFTALASSIMGQQVCFLQLHCVIYYMKRWGSMFYAI
jgi:DNA-3-methyladenine glycosylase II